MIAFVDPVALGQWLTLIAVLVAAFFIWRGGGGTALTVLSQANEVLEMRVRELEKKQEADAKLIAELQKSRDFALAFQPIATATEHHEMRAQKRFERTLNVLDLIASRLGPDNGTATE